MIENWYEEDDWYAPLRRKEEEPEPDVRPSAAKQKPKRHRSWAIAAIVVLLLIASSLGFRGSKAPPSTERPAETPRQPQADEAEDFPDDWKEFFENYYTKTETDSSEVNIERSEREGSFVLSLEPAEGEELSLQELYAQCAGSIVAISGYQNGKMGYNWGTGVILSEDGLILTNTHVVEDCDSAKVMLSDDREFDARLVGADAISDVAVLKIEATGLPAARFGDSSTLRVGDPVAAIGNPLGETFRSTLTDGIISAIERGVNYHGRSMTLLQTNTAINEGNSGGALFNRYGQVIGITNMKMMSSYSSIEGIGFAIPSATVCEVVNLLVKDGEVRGRTSIGITVGAIPEEAKKLYDLPSGLYISEVAENSDAAAQGVRPEDILLEVNHTPVATTDDVLKIKNQFKVGDQLILTIWRGGETMDIPVTLMDSNDIYG